MKNKKRGLNDVVKIILISVVSVMLALGIDICMKGNPFHVKKQTGTPSGYYQPSLHHRQEKETENEDEGQREYARLVTGFPVDNDGEYVTMNLQKEKVYGVKTVKTSPAEDSYGVTVIRDVDAYGSNVQKYSYEEADEAGLMQTIYSYKDTEAEEDSRIKILQKEKETSPLVSEVIP